MKLKNGQLNAVITFIDELNLKGKQSIGRTKLKDKLAEKLEAFGNDQVAIIDEFDGWTDREEGRFTSQNKELNEAMNELLNAEVDITYNSPFRKDFIEALENYDDDLSGTDADVYAVLYEQLIEGEK